MGGTVEALNTTLTQWEAAGILPVNRVSEIFTYKYLQASNLSKSLQYSLSGKSMAMQACDWFILLIAGIDCAACYIYIM